MHRGRVDLLSTARGPRPANQMHRATVWIDAGEPRTDDDVIVYWSWGTLHGWQPLHQQLTLSETRRHLTKVLREAQSRFCSRRY